jgi:phage protein U
VGSRASLDDMEHVAYRCTDFALSNGYTWQRRYSVQQLAHDRSELMCGLEDAQGTAVHKHVYRDTHFFNSVNSLYRN